MAFRTSRFRRALAHARYHLRGTTGIPGSSIARRVHDARATEPARARLQGEKEPRPPTPFDMIVHAERHRSLSSRHRRIDRVPAFRRERARAAAKDDRRAPSPAAHYERSATTCRGARTGAGRRPGAPRPRPWSPSLRADACGCSPSTRKLDQPQASPRRGTERVEGRRLSLPRTRSDTASCTLELVSRATPPGQRKVRD